MVNPIFSHDFAKFVLQNLSPMVMPPVGVPRQFSISPAKKTKKDMKKEDSPWVPKKPQPPQDKKS
ncbi:MAG: hypothetical protein H0W50_06330 [Parachlamydiaceae bacterium]|nr:hypothetical protein [Parachlamydiaceae bacterium]